MSDFVITCCSTVDKTREFLEKNDIKFVCFHYNINGKDYLDDLGQTMTTEEFYNEIKKGAMPRTSQVNVEEYIDFFEPFLKEGKDVLHVSLSSGVSGSFNSANIAKDELQEKYPDRKVTIIDSLCASSGYGMLVETLVELKNEGKSYDEICSWAEENKLNVHHYFFSTDLTSYIRGGRVSGVEGFVGNLLGICPLLTLDAQGKLIVMKKIRTKKKAAEECVKIMLNRIPDGAEYSGKCAISNSACLEDALYLKDLIEKAFPNLVGKVTIDSIGSVIGSHAGVGTVAMFFMGDKRD